MITLAKNQVTLTFAGDDKQLKRTFDDVGDGADRMARRVGDSGTRLQRAGIDVQEIGGHLMRLATIAATAAVAVGVALAAIAKTSVESFVEAQTQQAKLEDAYKRFPKIANVSIDAMRKLNTERMKTTRFDDDASAAAEATLAKYKLTGKQIMTLIPLVQDYAAATGKDLPDAAQTLGNALLGKGRALAEIGIKFKDAGSVTKNYTQLVEGLRKQVGGFANEEGKTAAGQLEILKNRFGEVEEAIGQRLLPIASAGAGALADFAEKAGEKFDDFMATVDGISLSNLPKLKTAAADTGAMIRDALGTSFESLKKFVKDNREEIDKFVGQLAGFTSDVGPAASVVIKSVAQNWEAWAIAIMKTVDALNALKDWYTRNISWLAPWVNVMLKMSGSSVNQQMQGQTMARATGVPKFHSGGTVGGAPGSETLAILQAGETVIPPGGGGGQRIVLELRASGSAAVETAFFEMFNKALDVNGLSVAGRPA